VRRGPLQDAALILLSPLWLLGILVGIPPVVIAGWVGGAIMLWLSRGWRTGEKLIGTLLSGVSLIYGGVFGVSVRTEHPDGVWAALALLAFLFLLQMVPATVGVVYLWKRLHARSAATTTGEQASERFTAA
jgi:FtsH-binding integral membrane protein